MMQLDDPHTDNDKNINPDLITDDDDNAATDDISEDENESPLVLALDDLESRIVASLNEFKSHPGRASNPRERNIHQELADILRPVVEASSHAGPSTARALAQTYPRVLGLEMCVDEIYTRVNSELVLPVVLESAQSDVVPAKRAASLAMFHTLYGEWQKGGSYLDGTTNNVSLSGPYGVGGASSSSSSAAAGGPQLLSSMETSRRSNLRSARKAELLRRWVQSAIPNLAPGTFTSSTLDAAAAGRGVLSASAALKPCLRYMAQRIGSADDAGALRLFLPVMRMIEGVLGRLFLERARNNSGMEVDSGEKEGDALRSSCIKFLEIVVLCFSNKALPGAGAGQTIGRAKKDASVSLLMLIVRLVLYSILIYFMIITSYLPLVSFQHVNDFSLEDLPPGHPIITRESLEEIGEYAYSTLRGLVVLGGQAKIDPNLLLAAAASSSGGADFMGGGSSPMSQIVAIIKVSSCIVDNKTLIFNVLITHELLSPSQPAALAFQTIESEAEKTGGGEPNTKNGFVLDRSSIELDFCLSQKSYSISINAIQMLGTKRPIFFKESSTCLARRTMDPPGESSGEAEGLLPKAAITAIRTHLRSSCLTMLRHFISVTSGSHEILVNALTEVGMGSQAERALQASRNQLNLMKGGRAARNRAAVFYEWDQSADASRAEKRQRDTDDAEARVRSAKIARGLGSGVQLPTSMADACELVLLNLKNLPPKRPPVASTTHRKHPVDLDFVVDAVLSNGASLSIDENHWYDRDGGDAWEMEEGEVADGGRKELSFHLNEKILETATNAAQKEELGDAEKVFAEQTRAAASKAFSRVLLSASSARSGAVANYGKQLAARLAWTLQGVQPSADIESAHLMAVEATEKGAEKTGSSGSLRFAKEYPLVSTCLAFDLVPKLQTSLPSDDNGSSSTALAASALSTRVLNEAYVCSVVDDGGDTEQKKRYGECLDVYVSSVVSACDSANKKPNDNEKKRIATNAASLLPHQLGAAPSITPSALNLVGSLCDIDEVSKKAVKTSRQSIAESAAAHAAKAAAEKRATAALLILRDVAFQRDAVRGSAIDCAVSIASGRLPASAPIEDKALKLVMNVIFPKNSDCASKVMESATKELEFATQYAIDNHDEIEEANKVNARKKEKLGHVSKSPLQPQSEEEKIALDRVRKPVVLIMALCVRRPEKIKDIMEMSCRDGANVLAKAVKTNMPKLAKAAAAKHGKFACVEHFLKSFVWHCRDGILLLLLTFFRRRNHCIESG
jgi:symplekin